MHTSRVGLLQDAGFAGRSELGSLVVNNGFNLCASMKAWSKDLVDASSRRFDKGTLCKEVLSDDRPVYYA